MIDVNINGQTKHIKSELKEISIDQFERFCALLLNDAGDILDRYMNIFSILGLSDDDIDLITPAEFLVITKQFIAIEWDSSEFVREVTIDGKTYVSYTGEKYVLSVRDLAKIEKYVSAKGDAYMAEMMAVIYKDPTIDRDKQYEQTHIEDKAKIFRKSMTADILFPYLSLIQNNIVTTLKNNAGK